MTDLKQTELIVSIFNTILERLIDDGAKVETMAAEVLASRRIANGFEHERDKLRVRVEEMELWVSEANQREGRARAMLGEKNGEIETLEDRVTALEATIEAQRVDTMTVAAERNDAVTELREVRAQVAAASEWPDGSKEAELRVAEMVARVVRMLKPSDIDALKARAPESLTSWEAAEVALWEVQNDGRGIRFLAELATMTDIECECGDLYEIRTLAQMLQVPGENVTVPRLYGDEDRKRAADCIWGWQTYSQKETDALVDEVAEALGMRRAGA